MGSFDKDLDSYQNGSKSQILELISKSGHFTTILTFGCIECEVVKHFTKYKVLHENPKDIHLDNEFQEGMCDTFEGEKSCCKTGSKSQVLEVISKRGHLIRIRFLIRMGQNRRSENLSVNGVI